ncbi:MAG: hypothetical protein HDR06_12165 [Lachnospiraceae bacterium]|nr:hypothetical protein [Lachnospiraceae bacterium]
MGKRLVEKSSIVESSISIHKIELNEEGDYIAISGDNAETYDKFVAGYGRIMDEADAVAGRIKQIEKQYEGKKDMQSVRDKVTEISKVNVEFSNLAVQTIDNMFGEGTVRKYFSDVYDEIPDFLPDAGCITDFFEKITPIMEKTFGRKFKKDELAREQRMGKYQPQDHKKSGNRRKGSKK